jgi:hypothetical protein
MAAQSTRACLRFLQLLCRERNSGHVNAAVLPTEREAAPS